MTYFSQNLSHLRATKKLNQLEFARSVGINRSVLSRLENGTRSPTRQHLEKLGRYSKLDAESFNLQPSRFRNILETREHTTDLRLISFRTIRENLEEIDAVFEKYKGQYTVYYEGARDAAGKRKYVTSLLEIERVSREGIDVKFWNPYQELTGEWTAYEYDGCLFPMNEFLYLLSEQKTARYEILSIILRTNSSPDVRLLRGLLSGIGVQQGRPYIAARPLIAIKRVKRLDNWITALGKELGYATEGQIPEMVRRELSTETITLI